MLCITNPNRLNFLIKNFKTTQCIVTLSTSSKLNAKKYNKPPPIDLKNVRTNTGENSKEDFPKPNRFASIILLAVPVVTFGLGIWQLKRREQKLTLIDYLEKRTSSEPVELPSELQDFETFVKENEYRPFKVRGHFIHSKESLLTMRHDLTGQSHLPGGFVITPFVVSKNPKMIILVNRGYVPYTHFSPTSRQKAQLDNEVELVGLLRSNEPLNTFTPVNKPPFEWHYRDVDQMSKELGTVPVFLDAAKSTTIPGGPLGGQTAIQLRNDHLTYLITWFTLSALTSILWWKRFSKAFF